MFKRVFGFVAEMLETAVEKVKDFFMTSVKHTEAIGILTLSAIGLNSLMGELPFMYMLPMWIEAPLVIPVLSVIVIGLLVKSAEIRNLNRRIAVRA